MQYPIISRVPKGGQAAHFDMFFLYKNILSHSSFSCMCEQKIPQIQMNLCAGLQKRTFYVTILPLSFEEKGKPAG